MKQIEQQVWDLIAPTAKAMGLRLVRVLLSGGSGNSRLQIMLEPHTAGPHNRVSVTIDDCAGFSRQISTVLDVEELFSERYTLEVSSTGLDRPLVSAEDFTTYAGERVRINLNEAVDGRKRFTGILLGMEQDEILLREEGAADVKLPLAWLKNARLYFTPEEMDNLLSARRQAERAQA